jgi:glycosyltransferase involved in cell wall biosynthesis
MFVTVAICTWNRANLLDQTLRRMRRLRVPEGVDWELLVVDNNCTDHTSEVITAHAAALPIRRLEEPQAGQSRARNTAVGEAKGELILWTDDDVLVDESWLSEYCRAASQWKAASYFGGTVIPSFESPPPPWLSRSWGRLNTYYAIREYGETVRPFGPGEDPFGANMAFRTDSLKRFAFAPHLGHRGSVAQGGDESDLIHRMQAAGHHGVWVGTAKVQHIIPTSRMTKKYLWDYTRRNASLDPAMADASPPRWVPRWLIRQFVTSLVQAGWASLRGGDDWAEHFIRAAALRGQIDAYRDRASTPRGRSLRRCPS